MSDVIRDHKRTAAYRIIEDLPTAADRLSVLRSFAFKLDDRDKLAEIAKLYDSGVMTGGELWDLLLNNYYNINEPSSHYADVLRLFREAVSANGPLHFDNDPVPLKAVRLYRASFPTAARGISWSWDRRCAEKFLTMSDKRLYTVVARPEHFLGVFSKIGEREVMLDPELIDEPDEVALL
jgi:hypothetical protein